MSQVLSVVHPSYMPTRGDALGLLQLAESNPAAFVALGKLHAEQAAVRFVPLRTASQTDLDAEFAEIVQRRALAARKGR